MKLAYESQLQEDYKGLKEECQFLTTVYMPCREMMEMFGWHTAERGVIRDAQRNIVAINREIPGEPLHALLVLRSKLDAYLEAKNKVLFWCLIGEKQLGNVPYAHIERLTAALHLFPYLSYTLQHPLNVLYLKRYARLHKRKII